MCKPFLLREIAAVQPEVIVVMGNTAMRNLLDTREGITKLRGEFQDYKGIKVMPVSRVHTPPAGQEARDLGRPKESARVS